MTTNQRYIIFAVLIVFGVLFYVNIDHYLFNHDTSHFEVLQERNRLLDVVRSLGNANQLPKEKNKTKYSFNNAGIEEKHSEKFISESDPEIVVKHRVESTRKVCEEKQFPNFYSEFKFKDTGHMVVDEEHKFIFCYIPKVSCSSWKRVLGSLYNTHRNGQRHLNQYSPEEIKYRLKNYRRVMFVRDPITRFLSAFLHKFYTSKPHVIDIWERTYGHQIVEQFRPWMNLKSGQTSLNITVSEFIKYIVKLGEDYRIDPLRDHWLPMYRSCDPCKFQPDFIGHFENLEVEGQYLLKWLGVSDLVQYPEYHVSDAATKLVNSYALAEMGLMRALRTYYHRDYELFDYSANDTMRKVLFGE
ncbi:carbohydrate sulfotransferase 14-like [Antedon mediterranea]|uniref:carbohydrate sulfotransferase 14-like n=1 Tax=Antedon mediterranea TaxID=105859 RepID=UPI003AF76BF6